MSSILEWCREGGAAIATGAAVKKATAVMGCLVFPNDKRSDIMVEERLGDEMKSEQKQAYTDKKVGRKGKHCGFCVFDIFKNSLMELLRGKYVHFFSNNNESNVMKTLYLAMKTSSCLSIVVIERTWWGHGKRVAKKKNETVSSIIR